MKNSSRPEDLLGAFGFLFVATLVKRRVDCVEILAIKLFLSDSQGIGKTIKGEWILRYPLFLNFPFDIQTVL